MIYLCRVTEIVEREVVVDAPGPALARRAAARPSEWLDRGAAVTVAVDVEHVQPQESMPDAMQAWKERVE